MERGGVEGVPCGRGTVPISGADGPEDIPTPFVVEEDPSKEPRVDHGGDAV